MLPEHHFIPFQTSALPAGPWLVFAPHPDDEAFGMGGALLLAHEAGIETHVIVLTDGALGGKQDNLVAIRSLELAQAAKLLQLTSVRQWSEPDRSLAVGEALLDRVGKAVSETGAQSVFFPGPLEPHPDHRTTTALVWRALQQLYANWVPVDTKFPTPISYEISVQNPVNLMLDITAVMAGKRTVMAVYNSQNAENGYPTLVEGLNKGRTFTLPANVQFAEAFYRHPPEELTRDLEVITLDFMSSYWQGNESPD